MGTGFGTWVLCSVRKINLSQILRIFFGSYSIKTYVEYVQSIMLYMIKSFFSGLEIPDTLWRAFI